MGPLEGNYGWCANTEKLLCLVVLNDHVADRLRLNAGDAFFRAFIVEDRLTGKVTMRFRFRYTDGDSWYRVEGEMCPGTFTLWRLNPVAHPTGNFRGSPDRRTCRAICPQCHKWQGALVRRRNGDALVFRINYHETGATP